jgi:hypothetical protein
MDSVSCSGAQEGIPYVFENGSWSWKNTAGTETKNEPTPKTAETILKPVGTIVPGIPVITPKETVAIPVTTPKSEATPSVIVTTKEVSAYEPVIFFEEKPTAKLVSKTDTPKTQPTSVADFSLSSPNTKNHPSPYQSPYVVVPAMMVFCGLILKFIVTPDIARDFWKKLFENKPKDDDLEHLFK